MNINYPLNNYNFYVYINNKQIGFQRITGMETSIEYETIPEGGLDYVHTLPIAITKEKSMIFEKGSGTFDATTPPFKVGERIRTPIHIFVIGDKAEFSRTMRPKKQYCILGAIVTKWSISEFNALTGETLMETFQINYSRLEEITF